MKTLLCWILELLWVKNYIIINFCGNQQYGTVVWANQTQNIRLIVLDYPRRSHVLKQNSVSVDLTSIVVNLVTGWVAALHQQSRAECGCHMPHVALHFPHCYLITPLQLGLQTTFWQPQSPQGMWLHRQWTGVSLARAWTPGFLSAALITSYCWCEWRPLILPAAAQTENRTVESCWKHNVPVTFPHFFNSVLMTLASSELALRLKAR